MNILEFVARPRGDECLRFFAIQPGVYLDQDSPACDDQILFSRNVAHEGPQTLATFPTLVESARLPGGDHPRSARRERRVA